MSAVRPRGAGRFSPLVYGGLSLVLVITVVVAAYNTTAPGFSMAEFAPSQQNGLDQTPSTQGGNRANGGKGGKATTTTSPLGVTTVPPSGQTTDSNGTPTTKVGRARTCYGNPPRQAEDFSSPPCIATLYEGDNGGATSKGVTGTEIRIAFPVGIGGAFDLQAKMLADWFNARYEFYGRKIVPVVFDGAWGDVNHQRQIASEIGASNIFGSIDTFRSVGPAFHGAMAREKVVTVAIGYESLLDDRTTYDALHPYLWGVYPSQEQVWKNFSSFACTALVGKPARHAPDFASATRKFGFLAVGANRIPYVDPAIQGLQACGAETEIVKIDSAAGGDISEKFRNAATSFKAKGVTTLVCACGDSISGWAVSVMTDAGFRPEIMHPLFAYGPGDEEGFWMQGQPLETRLRTFGMIAGQKIQPYQAYPWFPLHFALTPEGSSDGNDHDPRVMENLYRATQVLAAGLQMAGPNLTPDTFAQGLMSAQFPNEGGGTAPLYQPTVGFGPGDHTFYNDFALASWDETLDAYQWQGISNKGSFCYLDRGKRYSIGNFPADADSRFFSPSEPCR